MNRGLLALGVGAALAVVFALFVVFRSHDDDAPAPPPISHRPAGPRNPDRHPPRRAPTGDPAEPAASGSDAVGDGERLVGDVVVRDHRTGDHPVVDVPPAMNAPGGRKIASQVTFDISKQVRPLLLECGGKNVPAEARGAKPRLEGQLQIAIKHHQAQISRATFQMRDVTGDFDAVKTCVEQKSIGLIAAAPDEDDLETYAITTSYRLP
ncbi:MAG TPA: hypothetical protein VGC42_00285 [Kofleriaceae bacterium]